MKNDKITYDEAHRMFQYNHETGKLYWKISVGGAKKGDEAGYIHKSGQTQYRVVMVGGVSVRAHRIMWLMHYGFWPIGEIDHVDGDGLNNAICNLRDITKSMNQRNRRMQRNNKSGSNGITWSKPRCRWTARVMVDGCRKFLGSFVSIKAAELAANDYRIAQGFTVRHGQ